MHIDRETEGDLARAITRKLTAHSKLDRSQRCLFSEPADSRSADSDR